MLVVDTSVLLAARDRSERHHTQCAEVLRSDDRLILPAPVVVETCQLLRTRLGARHETQFVAAVVGGVFEVVDLLADDYRRVEELMIAYEDLAIGLVDAAIVAVAERLGASDIATLNYRDFNIVRPSHRTHFTLRPELAASN